MTYALVTVNPFYAARLKRPAPRQPQPEPPRYAKLPRAPQNASPVPHLTSLYHFDRAGEYGDRGYPGNCGGNLIKDLLLYFKPGSTPAPRGATCPSVTAPGRPSTTASTAGAGTAPGPASSTPCCCASTAPA